MSRSATAIDVRVLTARMTSAVASRSQVAAFSKPVLESARESLSSWAWRNERCRSETKGNAKARAIMLFATQKMTRTATQSSVTSLNIGSRENCTSRSFTDGSEPLTAVSTNAWLTAHCTAAHAATVSIQARACAVSLSIDACKTWARTRKASPAAKKHKPKAAEVKTRRYKGARRTRH